MVSISLPGYTQPIDSRVIAAAAEPAFASAFPFQQDMNTGNTVRFITIAPRKIPSVNFRFGEKIGLGWVQGAIGNGQRSSSATTYVGPDYINRQNLHILLHAHATKVLEATGPDTAIPTFNVVEFGTEPSGALIISHSYVLFC